VSWLRLQVAATSRSADAVGERLEQAGAVAVSTLPADDDSTVLEPGLDETPLWDAVLVQALLPLATDLGALADLHPEVDFIAEQDWSATWRSGLAVQRFGRLLVVPHDVDAHVESVDSVDGEKVVLRLDPGLAFGTGTHPSTALCLKWLAGQPLDGLRVLDVGSGSGILGIAALRLGAAAVVAVDRDPQARCATAANATANGVDIAVADHLDRVDGRFDVAVANIVANTLCAMAPMLVARADTVVLAGLLADQAERIRGAFAPLHFESPAVQDGWALLCGRRVDG
jgi:ribosomal protein L11 methyltransferase